MFGIYVIKNPWMLTYFSWSIETVIIYVRSIFFQIGKYRPNIRFKSVCIEIKSYLYLLVLVCPVLSVKNARVNTSGCLTNDLCPVGISLTYSCSEGYTMSSSVTACLADRSWSNGPVCIKLEDGSLVSPLFRLPLLQNTDLANSVVIIRHIMCIIQLV